jgi:hypothetical protein
MAIGPTNIKAQWLQGSFQLRKKPITRSESTNKKDGLRGIVSAGHVRNKTTSCELPILASATLPVALSPLE